MWITPKPFGAPALLGFWACGKAWDAPGIFWGKRHFGAPARGFWRRGGRAGRQPPGGNAEPRPQKGDFGRPKSGYPHYPQKRFPPKVEKKAQQLPGFWRRAHKLSTRLSTDRSAPPGASAQPQNRPKRGEKVYPTTLYHTLPAHANKRMGGGREGNGGEDGKGFAAPGGQWTKVYFLHFLRTGNAYQGQTENAPASAC